MAVERRQDQSFGFDPDEQAPAFRSRRDDFRTRQRDFDMQRGREEISGMRHDVASIAQDLRELAAKEAELARVEMGEQMAYARDAAIGGGVMAVSGLLLFVFAGLTLMFALDTGMPLWAAALITTAVFGLLAALAFAYMRERMRQITVPPKRTISSIQETAQWARRQLNLS